MEMVKVEICGIIPAYAGNTILDLLSKAELWDHPRVCGEHETGPQMRQPMLGSSPRMRGTLQGGGGMRVAVGIIPAYAGNTPPMSTSADPSRDHPRVCGEHIVQNIK